jgi:hypothetical protein
MSGRLDLDGDVVIVATEALEVIDEGCCDLVEYSCEIDVRLLVLQEDEVSLEDASDERLVNCNDNMS